MSHSVTAQTPALDRQDLFPGYLTCYRRVQQHVISPELAVHSQQKMQVLGSILHGILPFLAGWISVFLGYCVVFFSDFYLQILLGTIIYTGQK